MFNIKKINWSKYKFNIPNIFNKNELLSNELEKKISKYNIIIITLNNNVIDYLNFFKIISNKLKKIKIIIINTLNILSKLSKLKIDISEYYYVRYPINYNHLNEIFFKIKLELKFSSIGLNLPFVYSKNDIILSNHFNNKKNININLYYKFLMIQIYDLNNTIYRLKIIKSIDDFIKTNNNKINFLLIKNNKIILLFSTKSKQYFKTRCIEICNQISSIVFQISKLHIIVGISKNINNYQITDKNIIINSISECIDALKFCFYFGDNTIFFFDDINNKKKKCEFYINFYSKVKNSFSLTNKHLIFKHLKIFINNLNNNFLTKSECIFQCKIIIILLIDRIFEITNIDVNNFKEIFFNELENIKFLKDMYILLSKIINNFFETILSSKKNIILLQMSKAKNYIKKNYNNHNLSLNDVTEYIELSTSYFSNIFKSQTGMTFVEYLTKIRIEKAKQLFILSDKLIYEIAYDVGFLDAHYFSSVFKKNVGVSPREYKESFEKNS